MAGLVYFHEILTAVRQSTGINIMKNREADIRSMMADAEYEINPYGSHMIKKRMIYYKGNGNFDGVKIKKPRDFVSLEFLGDCKEPICKCCYRETQSHVILCDPTKERDKIIFTYFGLNVDFEGNPITTKNHKAAVVAYIVWKMYSPKVYMGQGNMNQVREYEYQFEMRCGEARGEDFLKGNAIKNMTVINHMTSLELNNLCIDHCDMEECIPEFQEGISSIEVDPVENNDNTVYWWQYNSLTQTVSNHTDIDDLFLQSQQKITKEDAEKGVRFNYTNIGRIGFAINNIEDEYSVKIFDSMDQDVISAMNKFYDSENKRLIFVSKDYYSHSTIFLKFEFKP